MTKTRFDKFPQTNANFSYTLDINLEQSSHVETVVLMSKAD